jgi:major membrane immunogen (membrane-anchored lipoprotein)
LNRKPERAKIESIDAERDMTISAEIRITGALVAAALIGGCGDGRRTAPSECRITYEMLDGAPSERVDFVSVSDDNRVVTRSVHETGGDATSAIYYYFDADGNLTTEALDADLDGELDARLDAGPVLAGLLTPYSVDAVIEDGALDGIQFSMPISSSSIGPWNPARVFYQVACDQGDFTAQPIGEENLDVLLDADDDGEPDGKMALQFGADGRLQTWTVDGNDDGQVDHVATLDYDEAGRVREVIWNRPEKFLGEVYVLARYTYDVFGKLYAYELDQDADGEFDHRITYSSGCFDYSEVR